MKFSKFGKALLMGALSAGVVLGVTSCVQSYSVGYMYVTGTSTASSTGSGIISGFKIDHNTGKLTAINGLPVSSGGANPVRAVMLSGGRFLYVLNRGANASGGSTCTTANPCQNSNITQFVVGGNGILTPQETFYSQGINPFRILTDSSGNFLYVLDHDSPSSAACALALGSSATACGDVTVFQINATTGRLQLVVNAAVTSASGSALTYFPVPANPIDFVMGGGNILTMSGTPATGDSIFPYTMNGSTGQLTINQNTSQPLNIHQGTALVYSTYLYVLDNESVTLTSSTTFPNGTYSSQILPFNVGSGGALSALNGIVPDDATLSNPTYLVAKGKFVYVANQGNNTNTTNAQSGIAGYVLDSTTSSLSFIAGQPFSSGAGPQCIVVDPSNQFIYTANYNDSTVTGRVADPNAGTLSNLRTSSSYTLTGPPTWCLVTGRTS
ncbi:MAG: beta-propeller fold lactonase family protein [Terracidiphilus sp.]|nr:beta-propeller fold lactonase family protein [Terracidiphilus sp.]